MQGGGRWLIECIWLRHRSLRLPSLTISSGPTTPTSQGSPVIPPYPVDLRPVEGVQLFMLFTVQGLDYSLVSKSGLRLPLLMEQGDLVLSHLIEPPAPATDHAEDPGLFGEEQEDSVDGDGGEIIPEWFRNALF